MLTGKYIERVSVLLIILGLLSAVLLLVRTVAAASTWSDTLGGVNLFAASAEATSYSFWESAGESDASQNITTIAVSTTGWENCNGDWDIVQSDSDSHSNDDYASTYDWSTKRSGCYTSHDCQTVSSHTFYKSGSFGAYPNTDETDWGCGYDP